MGQKKYQVKRLRREPAPVVMPFRAFMARKQQQEQELVDYWHEHGLLPQEMIDNYCRDYNCRALELHNLHMDFCREQAHKELWEQAQQALGEKRHG